MKNEVATEIIQTKGKSDTHPAMSPNDELANFELFRHLLGTGGQVGKVDHSYVRQALINGVGFQDMIGANPFKYGIVAGADAHTGFSDNEEFNYSDVHAFISVDSNFIHRLKPSSTGISPLVSQ